MSDPLSITASVIALLQLTATCTKYLKDVKHGSADRMRLRDELRSAASLLEMLKDRVEEADDLDNQHRLKPAALSTLAGTEGPLKRTKSILEEIVAKLAPQERLARLKQPFVWPFDKKDIAEMIASLERLKSHFSLVMQNDLIELAKLTELKVDEVNAKLDDARSQARLQEARDIIAWIYHRSFRAKYLDVLGSVHPGTGSWLLGHETYLRWFHGEIDSLWCPAGAGKTSIASLIIDHLERNLNPPEAVHAYIFCDYSHRPHQTKLSLLSSVLQQLLQQIPAESLPADVKMLYDSHKKYDTRPTLTQVQETVKKVLSSLKSCHVVVDALDECAESVEEALEFISALELFRPQMKVLVTSRPYSTFDDYFQSCARIDISAQDADVKVFLDASMSRPGTLSRHIRSDPTLASDITRTIVEESKGMFLLAKLHIESISRKLTRRDIRTSLKSLPRTIDATYADALKRVYSQTSELVKIAQSVLFWIAAASRPLSLVDLQHVYAVRELEEGEYLREDDLPDPETLTSVCGGLIIIENESKVTRVVHYTAQRYLEDHHAENVQSAQRGLAKASLSYLTLPDFASGVCLYDASMQERLNRYPFLDYAARFWGSDAKADMGLTTGMLRLVENNVAVQVANQASSTTKSRRPHWSQEYPRDVPALVLVATFELPDLVTAMINKGHNIEAAGSDGETALIRAAVHGNAETVRILLEKGAKVDAVDHMQETALHRAAKMGSTDIVEVLIAGGADVALRAFNQWTTLMAGVTSTDISTVEALVKTGIEINAETGWGDTALSIAIRNGLEGIAHLLVDRGAVLSGGRAGRRASTIASRRGYAQLVRELTLKYEKVAGKPLKRQSSARVGQLPTLQEGQTNDEEEFWEKLEEIRGFTYLVGFQNRYTVEEPIGKGHFASVFVCRNKVTGIRHATKVHSGWKSNDGRLRELRMMLFMQENPHTNLLHIRECFLDYEERAMRFVMELADGDLFQYVVAKDKLTENEARHLFLQIFSALEFLHRNGIAHRDIKPENILLVDESQTVKLADFGLTTQLGTDPDNVRYATTLLGTPSYVAPEILDNSRNRKYGRGVDMWSCGVVLYIALCGFPPFSDELYSKENPYTLSQQIKAGRFDYPSPYWDSVGDPALDLIDRLITVDPGKRLSAKLSLEHPWSVETSVNNTSILKVGLVDEPDTISGPFPNLGTAGFIIQGGRAD